MHNRTANRLFVGLLLGLLAGCANPHVPLGAEDLQRLQVAGDEHDQIIYRGTVTPVGDSEPAFRYERHVAEVRAEDDHPAGQVSTHVTFGVSSDAPLLFQRATHSPTYELEHFEEVQGQTGTVSSVTVRADGTLRFRVQRGEEREDRSEGHGDPVVVGPTLFGFVLEHWDALERGETLPVRFAVADQARSYAFTLRRTAATDEATTVTLAASDFFVSLGIEPMQLVFDRGSRRIVRYTGRVPPLLDGRDAFDAVVDYRFDAQTYR